MSLEEIKKLIDEMGNANIDELNIEFPDGIKISMKKNTNSSKTAISNAKVMTTQVNNIENSEVIQTNLDNKNNNIQDNYKIIKSPMVGTFYKSSSPDEKPFIQVGDKVKKGQIVCIVEAMKLMNEIESEYDGEVIEICVNNEDVVEYGMPLFKIK